MRSRQSRSRRPARPRPAAAAFEPVQAAGSRPSVPDEPAEGGTPARTDAGGPRPTAPADAAAPGGSGWGRTAVEAVLDRRFVQIGLGILLLAAAIRLPELAINPFHHDEGVNGFFTTRLVRANSYRYDPANYHGPSLYYFALLSSILFGLTTEAMRLVTVVAGIATVALVLPLRRYLGSMATLTAAGLLAISPGMIYMSRYFIHEMLLVCFSLGLIVSVILYLDQRRSAYLLAAAASAALIFATKETGIITVVVYLIAAVVADRYVQLRNPGRHNRQAAAAARQLVGGPRQVRVPGSGATPKSIWVDGVEYRPAGSGTAAPAAPAGPRRGARAPRPAAEPGGPFAATGRPSTAQLAGAAVMFAVIWVLLFSSFFTNWPKGLLDSVAAFTIWTQTGAATQIQPFTKYLEWMASADAPLLLLGIAGGLLVAWRAADRLSVFIGLWALGVTLAYSIIQYKTPWIVINMLVPLALLAGILVRELFAARVSRQAVPILLGASVLLSGYQAYDLNYVRYDDEAYPYVFVHTTREALALVDDVEKAGARAGTGRQTGVVLYTPDHWPLGWYLRNYPRAGYFNKIVDTKEPIVITRADQEKELTEAFTSAYARQREYVLRPGVKLVLFLRRDSFGL